jgi:hypothetical protein
MGFSDAKWEQRMIVMGDEAEGKFEEVYDKGFTRYGLRRPPIRVDWLPAFVRYTPDYLTSTELVEVMGVGADQTLKLKDEKKGALDDWNCFMDTTLFLWDSHRKRHCFIPYDVLHDKLRALAFRGEFSEGKTYQAVDVNDMDLDWTVAA